MSRQDNDNHNRRRDARDQVLRLAIAAATLGMTVGIAPDIVLAAPAMADREPRDPSPSSPTALRLAAGDLRYTQNSSDAGGRDRASVASDSARESARSVGRGKPVDIPDDLPAGGGSGVVSPVSPGPTGDMSKAASPAGGVFKKGYRPSGATLKGGDTGDAPGGGTYKGGYHSQEEMPDGGVTPAGGVFKKGYRPSGATLKGGDTGDAPGGGTYKGGYHGAEAMSGAAAFKKVYRPEAGNFKVEQPVIEKDEAQGPAVSTQKVKKDASAGGFAPTGIIQEKAGDTH